MTAPPAGLLPSIPNYSNSATALPTGSTASGGGTDVWDLGALYGQRVFLGDSSKPRAFSGDDNLKPGSVAAAPTYSTTQDWMKTASQLWSDQSAERKQNPGGLTTYEALQRQLWQAGFYGQTSFEKIHPGQWTEQTQGALKSALKSYEQASGAGAKPVTMDEFLQQNQQGAQDGGFYGTGGPGQSSAPTQVNLTDPTEIRAAVQSAAQAALGFGLSDDELSKFVSQFQGQQASAETSTGSSTTTPDLSSQAMAFAQQEDPAAYQSNKAAAYRDAFINMFAPSSSQRPSSTPVASA